MNVLAVIGSGFFLLITLLSMWSTRSFVARAARAPGIVVALNAGSAHPEIEFTIPSGEKVSFPAGGFISYNKGERATVLYLPEEPRGRARLDDFGELWLPDIVSGAIGMIVMLVGALSLVRARPR